MSERLLSFKMVCILSFIGLLVGGVGVNVDELKKLFSLNVGVLESELGVSCHPDNSFDNQL